MSAPWIEASPESCTEFYQLTSTCALLQIMPCCYNHLSNNDSLHTGRGSASYLFIIFIIVGLYASDGQSEQAFLPVVDPLASFQGGKKSY